MYCTKFSSTVCLRRKRRGWGACLTTYLSSVPGKVTVNVASVHCLLKVAHREEDKLCLKLLLGIFTEDFKVVCLDGFLWRIFGCVQQGYRELNKQLIVWHIIKLTYVALGKLHNYYLEILSSTDVKNNIRYLYDNHVSCMDTFCNETECYKWVRKIAVSCAQCMTHCFMIKRTWHCWTPVGRTSWRARSSIRAVGIFNRVTISRSSFESLPKSDERDFSDQFIDYIR